MADEDGANPPSDKQPQAEFRMELRDSLPGDRAVIGVEQEGEFMWLASRKHVTDQAVKEFVDQLQQIVHNGWWIQNWPGR
ncbi:hypothetical protein [Streptomyces sp. NPDC048200]|uniref:hypothetical protein n=1 Tax=Streptomyces sp. NPDC048200 TaxID=3365512 RepID=UPI003713508A